MRDTVAAPIEEQVSGVEGMMYMSSQCTNDGTYNLTVTFKLGMDSDMAQVLVQNRVSLALPVIPLLVQNEGITVKKMSPNTLMIVNLISPTQRTYDSSYLSNYATIYVKDELGRLPGVAGITYLGQRDYSLRAWLDPDKTGGPEPQRHGRGHRHHPAERAGGRRPDRPAARPCAASNSSSPSTPRAGSPTPTSSPTSSSRPARSRDCAQQDTGTGGGRRQQSHRLERSRPPASSACATS